MRSVAFGMLPLALVVVGCDEGSSSSGGGADSSVGGGDAQCADKACGEPCDACAECGQQICDGQGTCREALDVTCSQCPATAPANGEACPQVGLACEFADGIAIDCRVRNDCTSMGWQSDDAPFSCSPSYTNPSTCPMVQPSHGSPCGDPEAEADLCDFGFGIYCGCTTCLGGTCGGDAVFACSDPPGEGCPDEPPRLGSSCFEANLACTYGACWLEAAAPASNSSVAYVSGTRRCESGIWVEAPLDCP